MSGWSECDILCFPIWQDIFHFSESRDGKMDSVTQPKVWRGLDLDAGFSAMTVMSKQLRGKPVASGEKIKWLQLTLRI